MSEIYLNFAKTRKWFVNYALPFWSTTGYNKKLGLFHEKLNFNGNSLDDIPIRLMVQCRQIYVFSQATLTGKIDAKDLVINVFENIIKYYYNSTDEKKWKFSIDNSGFPLDERLDSYSISFLLLSFSWIYKLHPDPFILEKIDETLNLIDKLLSSKSGGVVSQYPYSDLNLRQNPNMHLLEAYLSLYEATGKYEFIERSCHLVETFSNSIFDSKNNFLPEIHSSDWKKLDHVHWYEPGHHFEWVWLLRQFQNYTTYNVDLDVQRLLQRSMIEGIDDQGYVIDTVNILKQSRVLSRRCWTTCELLKACSTELRYTHFNNSLWLSRANQSILALNEGFLRTVIPGLWNDRIDHRGEILSKDVPASSFYHIANAISELDKNICSLHKNFNSWNKKRRNALFLDRDGIINVDTGYPRSNNEIIWVKGIENIISAANRKEWLVIVVSNQSSVARGIMSEIDVLTLHNWMSIVLQEKGAIVDAWYHCPFHNIAYHDNYNIHLYPDRKPMSGLLKRAAVDYNINLNGSHLVGDKESDLQAAILAGVTGHIVSSNSLNELDIRSIGLD